MRKLAIVIAAALFATTAWGQGTVAFSNLNGAAGLDSPIFDVDGTTGLQGDQYMVELLVGADAASLAPAGVSATFSPIFAGYFFGSEQSTASAGGGATMTVAVRAWDTTSGATYDAATIKNTSDPFTYTFGDPSASPPSPAPAMTGLQSFQLVPEPSTIALGILGALALFIRRRK